MTDGDKSVQKRSRNRQSRGRGLRKTTGCITCRRRHVKCDEERPRCNRCSKGELMCTYGSMTADPDKHVEAVESPIIHPMDPPREGRSSLRQSSPPVPVTHGIPSSSQTEFASLVSRVPPSETSTSYEASSCTAVSPYTASPAYVDNNNQSVVSPYSQPLYNAGIAKWFNLLIEDSDFDPAITGYTFDGTDGDKIVREPRQVELTDPVVGGFTAFRHNRSLSTTSSVHLIERQTLISHGAELSERQRWQAAAPLALLPHEHLIFQNFVQHISNWIDLFDPSRNFSTFVPHLAIRNLGLMKAILALSARHLSLQNATSSEQLHNRNDSLQYYNETLNYVAVSMQYDTYKTSLELLATALTISTYEMLNGSGKDWERHLQGVFWIQRSQVIHGDSKGLKQAVWWTWLCQDVWAAFREKRETFTFWQPVRTFADMNPHELAARAVFVMAKVVNYCAEKGVQAAEENMTARMQEADRLLRMLDDWQRYLTIEFKPLPMLASSNGDIFQPVWIHPPAFGVAMQLHNAAHLLLLLHRPSRGGVAEYVAVSKLTQKCVAEICGIAVTLTDYASSIMCSQCLFIAGMCVQAPEQRSAILKLLDLCHARAAWPVGSLSKELKLLWEQSGD